MRQRDYELEERVAIMEFDGGLSRPVAEIAARMYRKVDAPAARPENFLPEKGVFARGKNLEKVTAK